MAPAPTRGPMPNYCCYKKLHLFIIPTVSGVLIVYILNKTKKVHINCPVVLRSGNLIVTAVNVVTGSTTTLYSKLCGMCTQYIHKIFAQLRVFINGCKMYKITQVTFFTSNRTLSVHEWADITIIIIY